MGGLLLQGRRKSWEDQTGQPDDQSGNAASISQQQQRATEKGVRDFPVGEESPQWQPQKTEWPPRFEGIYPDACTQVKIWRDPDGAQKVSGAVGHDDVAR